MSRCPPPTLISEAAGVECSVNKSFRQAPLFLGLFTAQVFIGAAIAVIPGNLITLLVQVLNGLITPILLTYVLMLANRRGLPNQRCLSHRRYRQGM